MFTGPTWVLSASDGPHVGPMNLAIEVQIIVSLRNKFSEISIMMYKFYSSGMHVIMSSIKYLLFVHEYLCVLKYFSMLIIEMWLWINSLWLSDAVRWQGSGSTLDQVMAWCRMASSHYLNQCWLDIKGAHWHSPESNSTSQGSTLSFVRPSRTGKYFEKLLLGQVVLLWHLSDRTGQ